MKLNIQEIRKQPEGLHFEQALDLASDLRARNQEILDVKDILAVGKVQYEDRLYFLDYQLSYTIVLASSRSMEPVELAESYPVTEVFMEGATNQLDQEVLDDDLVLPIENGEIDLAESVADNILLNIPIKVLTAEEEDLARSHGFQAVQLGARVLRWIFCLPDEALVSFARTDASTGSTWGAPKGRRSASGCEFSDGMGVPQLLGAQRQRGTLPREESPEKEREGPDDVAIRVFQVARLGERRRLVEHGTSVRFDRRLVGRVHVVDAYA